MPEFLQERSALPLREPGEGCQVDGAVAVLREEPGHGLGGVIRAEHEQSPFARDRVLRDHADAGLHVALVEVGDGVGQFERELVRDARRRLLDVERHALIGLDEVERELRVGLVLLHAVRESDGDEHGLAPVGTCRLDGELGEATEEEESCPPEMPRTKPRAPVASR